MLQWLNGSLWGLRYNSATASRARLSPAGFGFTSDFCLSFPDIQEMMLQRGVEVSHEAIRLWCLTFGAQSTLASFVVDMGLLPTKMRVRSTWKSTPLTPEPVIEATSMIFQTPSEKSSPRATPVRNTASNSDSPRRTRTRCGRPDSECTARSTVSAAIAAMYGPENRTDGFSSPHH